jgi:hypothetical protein
LADNRLLFLIDKSNIQFENTFDNSERILNIPNKKDLAFLSSDELKDRLIGMLEYSADNISLSLISK